MTLYDLWVEQLVSKAEIDSTRLARGASSLKKGQVGAIEVEPGLVRAVVHSSAQASTVIGISLLGESSWAEFMEMAGSRASLSAALLVGELPEELAEHLLPVKGDVSCDCSCADGAEPCVHAAAILHAVGDLFTVEPFALLLVRGRGRNDVLTELRARRAKTLGIIEPEGVDLPRGVDPGSSATQAWRQEPSAVATVPRIAPKPGSLVTLAASPPSDAGIDEVELRGLVADAAERAHGVLTGDGETGLGLAVGADVVRRAAGGDVRAISAATKVPYDELASAAEAWRLGGAAGLRVSRHKWDAGEEALKPGIAALGEKARARANSVSYLGSQLRLDEDGVWWLFRADDDLGWVLASEGSADPRDLI